MARSSQYRTVHCVVKENALMLKIASRGGDEDGSLWLSAAFTRIA